MSYEPLDARRFYAAPALRGGASVIITVLVLLAASPSRMLGQVVIEFPVTTPGSSPSGITSGPDGNLWFLEKQGSQVGRITPAGVIHEFVIPTPSSGPILIATGSDGNLWFTELDGNNIGKVTPAGVITEVPVPTANSQPGGIALGPDGSLWFTEEQGNKIGRITTSGVITEFPVPTPSSAPIDIAAGPDGNLWFTESNGNQIGRITTAGVVTEFTVPTPTSSPIGIAFGPDGNLWFAEQVGGKIARCTTAGTITEFIVPTAQSGPSGIAAGPDGNLWFTETGGNKVGRITTAGAITDFPVLTPSSSPGGIVAGPDGNVWFTEFQGNRIGKITTAQATPGVMAVDAHSAAGDNSNHNGVFEPGETVQVAPAWKNTLASSQTLTGAASSLSGPAGPTYTLVDGSANFGTVLSGATANCNDATSDCYLMTVVGARPTAHWDATFTETLSPGAIARTWKLHLGGSFADVPASNPVYPFVENLFHNGVTGGCAGGGYCPGNIVTRAQMAVFLMKAKFGSSHIPPPATGTLFGDVPANNPFAPWIEELAGFQVTGGCGSGNYCPNNPVTRAQMAVFLLKTEHGSAYLPPACTGVFPDVVCPSTFANWIEQLFHENITSGCSGGNYCPGNPVNRGQMAVFLVKAFGLLLYGP